MTLIVVYLHDAMGKTLFRTWINMYKNNTEAWQRVNSKLQLRYV